MKKLVLLLSIMLISAPVFAQQCTVNRLQKEMSDIMRKDINPQGSPVQTMTNVANAVQGSYLWRPGWTQLVTADVIPSASNGCQPVVPSVTLAEEQQLTQMMQYNYNLIFMKMLMNLRQNPNNYKNYTQAKINELLGK